MDIFFFNKINKKSFEMNFESQKINDNITLNKEVKDQSLNFNPLLSDYESISLNEYKIEKNWIFNDIGLFPKFPPSISNLFDNKIIDIQTDTNTNLEKAKNNKIETNNIINFGKDIQKKFSIITEDKKIENLKNDLVPLFNKKLGRKRKSDNSIRGHTKFSEDNMQRKLKNIILKCALDFINERIKIVYNGNIGKGPNTKQLENLNSADKKDTSNNFCKNLLTKTLGEIFSEDNAILKSYIFPDYNRKLIKRLLNEKDENKKNYFQKLFDTTFLECVKQFRGSDNFEKLKGFRTFEQESNKFSNDPEYIDIMKKLLMKFEIIIQNKKERKIKKNERIE